MTLKVNHEYLEFNQDIDIEKKIKLFEEIDRTQGDFSYQFEVPKTSVNQSIFKLYSINQNDKIIYQEVPCQILGDDGLPLYEGYIRVDSANRKTFFCSFFSGNNNWFIKIKGNLRDLDFSEYDHPFTLDEISPRYNATEGILYPLINTGTLSTRASTTLITDDFKPFFYVHTVISKIFLASQLKLQGELIKEDTYTRLITAHAEDVILKEDVIANSSYIEKTTITNYFDDANEVIQYDDFTEGGLNWDSVTNSFTAPIKMTVTIKLTALVLLVVAGADANGFDLEIRVNGITRAVYSKVMTAPGAFDQSTTYLTYTLEPGDVVDTNFIYQEGTTGNAELREVELSIIPTRIFRTYAYSILPDWTNQKFVNEIFKIFNPLITYDKNTSTVTVNLFKYLENKEEVDLSEYVDGESVNEDYTDFVSGYGRQSFFRYGGESRFITDDTVKFNDLTQQDEVIVVAYNNLNTVPYGDGAIDVDNDYIEESVDILTSDFTATIEDSDNPFEASIAKVDFLEAKENTEYDISTVTDVLTVARFSTDNTLGLLSPGVLVRISGSSIQAYNGDWVVAANALPDPTYFQVVGLTFQGVATNFKAHILTLETKDSDQVLLLAAPGLTIDDFTPKTTYTVNLLNKTLASTAYFNLPLQGLSIDNYKQSLAFGTPNEDDRHQQTMLDTYWQELEDILADPVKITHNLYLPKVVFLSLNFDHPIRIKTPQFNAKFFANRLTGYKNSHMPCEIELIKF